VLEVVGIGAELTALIRANPPVFAVGGELTEEAIGVG